MVRTIILLAFLVAAAAAEAGAQTEYLLGDGGWVKVREPEPGTDAAFIADCRKLLADRKWAEARKVLTKWIEEHKFTDSPYLADAYLLRGDARQGAGDEYLALYDYKKVTTDFPATTTFITAIQREMDIAIKYLHGMNRRFLGIRWYGAETEAVEILVRVSEQMPLSVQDEQAELELIRYYYRTRDLVYSATTCDIFLTNFPRSAYRSVVLEYRIKSNIGLFAGPEYDGHVLIEARELIKQFMMEFPADAERTGLDEAMLARLDESGALQMLTVAQYYLRRGEAASARYTLHRLVRDYSLTVAASRGYQILAEKGWTAGISPPGPEEPLPVEEDQPRPADAPAPEPETPPAPAPNAEDHS